MATLPASLEDVGERVETEPSSPLTAAWGSENPVTLRCGVGRPSALTPLSQVVSVNDVDWFPEDLGDAWRMTTYGRKAFIEVTAPKRYGSGAEVVVDFAASVAAAIPLEPEG